MTFELIFDKNAFKELSKLSKIIRKRIIEKIEDSADDPLKYFEKLRGRKDYKLRIGNYRVIADINLSKKRIEVTRIGHRKHIYKF